MTFTVQYYEDVLRKAAIKRGRREVDSTALIYIKYARNAGYMSDAEVLEEIGNILKAAEVVNADQSIPWIVEKAAV